MSDVTVLLCSQCKERVLSCICAEGFHHSDGRIIPPLKRLHCSRCDAPTHQFVKWEVGDSFSYGPLCIEHTNILPGRYTAVAVDNVEYIAKMISGSSYAVQQ